MVHGILAAYKVAKPSVPDYVVCGIPCGTCSYLLGAWHRQCCGAVIFRCGGDSEEESCLQRSPIPSSEAHPRPHRGSDGVQEPLLGAGSVGESHSVAFADVVSTGACSTFLPAHTTVLSTVCNVPL